MKIRVSDFIVEFLAENGIKDCFTVVGGGAMYLNDSFGHNSKINCLYNHHEQASAMAAEAYARINNKIAAVCVTTGPGATNAITGVVCGWMDSIPMLILSGQVRYDTTVYKSGLNLRTRGIQEFDIIGSVKNMTKYCVLIDNPNKIKYCLQKALYTANSGRPGPCWLDIPLDIQSSIIETDNLEEFKPIEELNEIDNRIIEQIINKIKASKRPILFVGNGVRLGNAHEKFLKLVDLLNIPVVTGMSSIDAIASNHRLYVGRNGITGDRAGNFAIQNCDLLLSLGSRLSFSQTGFNYKKWATNAYKIINDIDNQELEKDSLNPDMKICCDVSNLIDKLLDKIHDKLDEKKEWIYQCQEWKNNYPVVMKKHYEDIHPNIYVFYKELTSRLLIDDCIVASCGTSRVVGSQASIIKGKTRFITNPSTASMGYDLPTAIGVCIANNRKKTILVTGEGSLQMNIQEFQTIVQNKLPIIIFIMNNQGYHSIRMTQNNYFNNNLVGVGEESGDLSFPDLSKLVPAYGIDYKRCENSDNLIECIEWALSHDTVCVCELMLSKSQITEPKVTSKKLDDGKIISATLEDMAPFLSESEIEKNMLISKIDYKK